ncbi:LON peptidase substrate-binding domain-containing protein [Robbsia sp. Bb-Pol-6]|uniref:LON peptidase substrate-binding domain-containing protein n=1 Tax=Robbsia betulipollinis TaxID=2981849 RepID=A0ABT3ZKY2_9BURK|nr:LON peptidase substrate-binding domain-containing protein [Robbsia betulipollinis]MCY0387181.1 LON peptidase substrate-binding domain-containing protein [Robbsia betulipollinis]
MDTPFADLPLFPLGTVLFPDGLLPLRVFEARYVDMVGECLRKNTPFGVCLLRSGTEVTQAGQVPIPEAVGCLADIVDCDMEQLGVLLVRCRGSRRFRLLSSHTEKNGLLRGIVEPVGDDVPAETAESALQLASCAEVLGRIIDTLGEREKGGSGASLPFIAPYRLDDATWVSNRLAEVLPISIKARQQLMELEDAGARLDIVHQYMRRNQLL